MLNSFGFFFHYVKHNTLYNLDTACFEQRPQLLPGFKLKVYHL